MSKSDLQARIRTIHKKGQTGILRVRSPDWPDHDLFFMGGDLIACGCPDDLDAMGALLVAVDAVSLDALAAIQDSLQEGEDLADELVQRGGVAAEAVMGARRHLFDDNLAWASVATEARIEFEGQDMVFPPNMQFGLVVKDLLGELKAWRQSARPGVAALHEGGGHRLTGDAGDDPVLGALAALPSPFVATDALSAIGPPRRAALVRLAELLRDGVVVPDADEPDLDDEAAPDDDITELAAGRTPLADPDATEGDEGQDQITHEDYERAARGEFIKSYDVLDKVDLSGVKVLGTEQDGSAHPSIPAIEALGADFDDEESAIELGDQDSMDGILALDDEDILEALASPLQTRPELAPVAAPAPAPTGDTDDIELMSDDFAMFDDAEDLLPPPVQEVEINYEADEDALSEEPLPAIVLEEDEDAGATGTFNLGDEVGVFDREQLNDFHHRIDVFNNIFRIIFKSFAEHIGAEKSQLRFNALLSSSQRQYPELFQNLAVDADGSVLPAPLINNLSNCPPGDYGSLLHQGLYELIFSHLYDAKDMLPGNAETEMMEQIVVFERQLHQM